MKNLVMMALLASSVVISSSAMAAGYEVYSTREECRAAAKTAWQSGEAVTDCRQVDGGWTYTPKSCQDGQCSIDEDT